MCSSHDREYAVCGSHDREYAFCGSHDREIESMLFAALMIERTLHHFLVEILANPIKLKDMSCKADHISNRI
jgi:hypothetical protein